MALYIDAAVLGAPRAPRSVRRAHAARTSPTISPSPKASAISSTSPGTPATTSRSRCSSSSCRRRSTSTCSAPGCCASRAPAAFRASCTACCSNARAWIRWRPPDASACTTWLLNYAARFCRRVAALLERRRNGVTRDLMAELRRFYRWGNVRKTAPHRALRVSCAKPLRSTAIGSRVTRRRRRPGTCGHSSSRLSLIHSPSLRRSFLTGGFLGCGNVRRADARVRIETARALAFDRQLGVLATRAGSIRWTAVRVRAGRRRGPRRSIRRAHYPDRHARSATHGAGWPACCGLSV